MESTKFSNSLRQNLFIPAQLITGVLALMLPRIILHYEKVNRDHCKANLNQGLEVIRHFPANRLP